MRLVGLLRGAGGLEGLQCGEEGCGVGWVRDEADWRLGVGDVT